MGAENGGSWVKHHRCNERRRRLQLHNAPSRGLNDDLGATGGVKLFDQAGYVELGSVWGDAEAQGYGLVRKPLGEKDDNFALTRGECDDWERVGGAADATWTCPDKVERFPEMKGELDDQAEGVYAGV